MPKGKKRAVGKGTGARSSASTRPFRRREGGLIKKGR